MDRKAYHMILKRRGYDVISQMYSCKYLVLSFSNALFTVLDSNVTLRNPCLRFHVLPRINIRTMILGSSSFLEQVKPHFLPPLFPRSYISTRFASRSTNARFLDAWEKLSCTEKTREYCYNDKDGVSRSWRAGGERNFTVKSRETASHDEWNDNEEVRPGCG